MNPTATDRKTLIRLASSMEKGSNERKAILAGLEKTAMGYLSEKDYERGVARHMRPYCWSSDIKQKFHDPSLGGAYLLGHCSNCNFKWQSTLALSANNAGYAKNHARPYEKMKDEPDATSPAGKDWWERQENQ